MAKAPEEGEIYEWRAFGRVGGRLADTVRAHPIRNGVRDQRDEDLYFIPPVSNQNVKLRKGPDGWALKFKLLCESRPDGIELYFESARLTERFPINGDTLREAARLLDVRLAHEVEPEETFTLDEFRRQLAAAHPAPVEVPVPKVRSQFLFEGGWVEMADVDFPVARVQTLSLHALSLADLSHMLDKLRPGDGLSVMNYVQACRRWKS